MSEYNHQSANQFKALIRKVKKQGGYTQQDADELSVLIHHGGWLYGAVYFAVLPAHRSEEPIELTDLSGDYATLRDETPTGTYIPLYTSETYAQNVADMVRLPAYPYVQTYKILVQSALQKAKELELAGIRINPQREGITISL